MTKEKVGLPLPVLEFPKCFCRSNHFAIRNNWKYGHILIHLPRFKIVIFKNKSARDFAHCETPLKDRET